MNLDEARERALALMVEHGIAAQGWTFGWDRAKSRFGQCNYTRKRITLSAPVTAMNDWPDVRDTMLHEIAHALAGPGTGHGSAWRSIARSIGCNGERTVKNIKTPPPKWVGTCPNGHTRFVDRLTTRRRRASCGQCSPGGVWSEDHLFNWQPNPEAA